MCKLVELWTGLNSGNHTRWDLEIVEKCCHHDRQWGLLHKFARPWHRIIKVGKNLQNHWAQTPLTYHHPVNFSSTLSATCSHFLNVCDSTTSLGEPIPRTILSVKKILPSHMAVDAHRLDGTQKLFLCQSQQPLHQGEKKRKNNGKRSIAQESLRKPKPLLIMLVQVVNFSMVSTKQLYLNQWLIMEPWGYEASKSSILTAKKMNSNSNPVF